MGTTKHDVLGVCNVQRGLEKRAFHRPPEPFHHRAVPCGVIDVQWWFGGVVCGC